MDSGSAEETLLHSIAKFLNCSTQAVRRRLENEFDRAKVLKEFQNKQVRTLYKDRDGKFGRVLRFDGISEFEANNTFAYGNLNYVYNPTVPRHFYSVHRIKTTAPYHRCMVYIPNATNPNKEFYPLDLVQLVPPTTEKPSDNGGWEEEHIYDEIASEDKESSSESSDDDLDMPWWPSRKEQTKRSFSFANSLSPQPSTSTAAPPQSSPSLSAPGPNARTGILWMFNGEGKIIRKMVWLE